MAQHGFLPRMQAYFFDLDGCIYHGDRLSAGVVPLLDRLRQQGLSYVFLTNNSRLGAAEIGSRLEAMGLTVPDDRILPVTDIAGKYLRDKYGKLSVKTIGSDSLARNIAEAGHTPIAWDAPGADVVIVGRDTEFHYNKLQRIAADIGHGSRLIATNPDRYHPGQFGERVPETGSLLAAIEAVTGKTAECIGKPEPYMFEQAMQLCGAAPDSCVMVGDNLETDIRGSRQAGLRSVWITNGSAPGPAAEGGAEVLESRSSAAGFAPSGPARPDVVVNDMEELYQLVMQG
ncbi:HAD-IIA family hydrolase [Paenibacillus chartarius]|uniref:HAD-IIA family hydrolase n=1 Tax=Paenibacillus chartarius TaxID=747481 RepID=A0ABV6DLF8_9BACL